VALNLTSRQLICFGSAAVVGLPTYFLTRGTIGNSSAVLLMIGLMLPAFFIALYEKDGRPAEKILLNILRLRWFFPGKRPYKTENFYRVINTKGVFVEGKSKKVIKSGTTPVGKCQTGKIKQKGTTVSTKK